MDMRAENERGRSASAGDVQACSAIAVQLQFALCRGRRCKGKGVYVNRQQQPSELVLRPALAWIETAYKRRNMFEVLLRTEYDSSALYVGRPYWVYSRRH